MCGLCQEAIQRKLLAEDKLIFKKASEIAQAMELAERNTTGLKAMDNTAVQVASDNCKVVQHKQKQEISNRPLPVGGVKRVVIAAGDSTIQNFADFEPKHVEGVAR